MRDESGMVKKKIKSVFFCVIYSTLTHPISPIRSSVDELLSKRRKKEEDKPQQVDFPSILFDRPPLISPHTRDVLYLGAQSGGPHSRLLRVLTPIFESPKPRGLKPHSKASQQER